MKNKSRRSSSHNPARRRSFFKRYRVVALMVAVFVLAAAFVSTYALAKNKKRPKTSAKEITLQAKQTAKVAKGNLERKTQGDGRTRDQAREEELNQRYNKLVGPKELKLTKASRSFDGDVRNLPRIAPKPRVMPDHEGPHIVPQELKIAGMRTSAAPRVIPAAPAPTPNSTFAGIDFATLGAGFPPDTVGDVGANHYIQAVNTGAAIFNKAGVLQASFSFDTLMSQGAFGNLCDTDNFGDPVVLYDTFEDRWVLTDFAFQVSGGNVVNPPGAFQCFAVSKTNDPVAGGWNFYFIQLNDGLNDYPKFGVWPDGIYMTANVFGFGSLSGSFLFARQWAFNKAQMYAGHPNPQIVAFDAPRNDPNNASIFTTMPSNARLQVGTPPPGTPNYYVTTGAYLNALQVFKFSVNWNNVFLSTFTGPDIPLAPASWATPPATVPSQGGNNLDTLATRAMMQNQYANLAGAESLWLSHTVRGTGGATHAGVRWYQLNVTGTTVAANTLQASTHSPDTTVNRFMPSLAVNRLGDMMIGYSASNSTMKPAIRYAGRLAADPVDTLPQTEVDMFAGTGTQVGNCGGSTCTRWGDYSAMSLDVDGCTFWYTQEYYAVDGLNWQTRVGNFAFPCTALGSGTIQGTVTDSVTTNPISGATVALGSRTTTTNGSGFYSFASLPEGTYPTESASKPGYSSGSVNSLVVTNGGTTVQNFALAPAPTVACLTDTTQADFQMGVPTDADLAASPGSVVLGAGTLDQFNTSLGGNGVGATITNWAGQTFTPAVTGPLTRADIAMFCSGCTGTIPNLTLSLRNTAAGLPTGADLASATIPGFSFGGTVFYTGNFASPVTVSSGTQYALIIRPTANPAPGTYAMTRSGSAGTGQSTYASGTRVNSIDSGTTWTIPTTGGVTTDAGFRIFIKPDDGNLVSSLKDANPAPGTFPQWTQLRWNAATPANTSVQFQVAASNSATGPFNFVGPDNTAGTFFTTSPSIITQFNNNRYLKYKAYLSTTDSSVTPSVNDVTVCYSVTPSAPTASDGTITGRILSGGDTAVAGVVINMSGTQTRKTITDANGNYRFDNVETSGLYSIRPSMANFTFSPAERSFTQLGNHTEAAFTATPIAQPVNPIDTAEYFVRQHYLDFLGREPDESGFNFWSDQILACGADLRCRMERRIHVSAAYFHSIEFNQTGGLVDGLYRASFGRRPTYGEFMPDSRTIAGTLVVGRAGWEALLEANKQSFVDAWVLRDSFRSAYDGLSNSRYVDELISHTGVAFSSSERNELVNGLNSGTMTRARALRTIVENERFVSSKLNEMFVMMEYYGYLRRDPDPEGFAYWLNKLNQFNGNFVQAQMVEAFISSIEYRGRFQR